MEFRVLQKVYYCKILLVHLLILSLSLFLKLADFPSLYLTHFILPLYLPFLNYLSPFIPFLYILQSAFFPLPFLTSFSSSLSLSFLSIYFFSLLSVHPTSLSSLPPSSFIPFFTVYFSLYPLIFLSIFLSPPFPLSFLCNFRGETQLFTHARQILCL